MTEAVITKQPTDLPSHPFWEFSLAVYQENTIKLACLALQEKQAMNVNIILFTCWLAKTGRGRLYKSDYTRMTALLHHWHLDITQRLRTMRRTVSKHASPPTLRALKPLILNTELVSEQIEQLLLSNHFLRLNIHQRTHSQKAKEALASLNAYAKFLNATLTERDEQTIEQIVQIILHQAKTIN